MSCIYMITNLINNKKYIGKTTTNIQKRFREHINDSKKRNKEKRPLYNAINKYGAHCFEICEIEQCSINNLSEREIFWINYYNTYKNGYNATFGGDGKHYIDNKKVLKAYKKTGNISEVHRICGYDKGTISKILKNNMIIIKTPGEVLSKKVSQYDLNGNFIKTYKSYKEAEKAMGNTQRHIADVANGKRKTAYGYIWKWTN